MNLAPCSQRDFPEAAIEYHSEPQKRVLKVKQDDCAQPAGGTTFIKHGFLLVRS